MKQDISSIVSADGSKISFHGKSSSMPINFRGNEFVFEKDMEIDGEIANSGGAFILNATVNGELITDCARCGKPVRESFSFELNEKLIKEGSACTDEDAVLFSGNVIDIGDLAVNGFLMNTPSKYLCSEDCKGLCPVCGVNLNEKQCSCEDENIDPRLEILNNLKF